MTTSQMSKNMSAKITSTSQTVETLIVDGLGNIVETRYFDNQNQAIDHIEACGIVEVELETLPF